MSCCDTNLSDDMVKLVSYSIVSIQRGRERVLLCNACKVFTDNMDDCSFDSWVIADYIEGRRRKGKRVPRNNKDLRVAYCVLGRWPKQDLNYEEKELRRLAGIEDAIRHINPPPPEPDDD